ncbi:RILP-like protein 1 [Tupaia chinensis]|uniref:RILP-like protein 1 n=2 Tax=Euarchontoglires TaxID=314146 RepID=L9KWF7_TUPCH|nr:RILP-like protein 1 [Tupaia chinensis]
MREEERGSALAAESALEKNVAELTVMDVYDIASLVGHEFERVIDQHGCEAIARLMPKVVRVLEILEVLVSRHHVAPELDELRLELDRLRLERMDRIEKERKHQKEHGSCVPFSCSTSSTELQQPCPPLRPGRTLTVSVSLLSPQPRRWDMHSLQSADMGGGELELVEDVWRGEAQDLLSQIAQLQEENKQLMTNLSHKDTSFSEEEFQKHEGMSERERQVMKKLKEVVDKQRDEIRAKDRELGLKNEDVEALQQQQTRLMKINHDLRHRVTVVEAQGKALIEQKVELEADLQTKEQEMGSLRAELGKLRERLQGELSQNGEEEPEVEPGGEECISDAEKAAMDLKDPNRPRFTLQELRDVLQERNELKARVFLLQEELAYYKSCSLEVEPGGEECISDAEKAAMDLKDPNRPRFTLQELRDVLQERNELKARVFLLQEELAYYKSDEMEEENRILQPPPVVHPRTAPQPESGIKRLACCYGSGKTCRRPCKGVTGTSQNTADSFLRTPRPVFRPSGATLLPECHQGLLHAYPSRTVAAKFLSRAVVKAGAPFLPGMVRAAKEAHGLCQDFTGTETRIQEEEELGDNRRDLLEPSSTEGQKAAQGEYWEVSKGLLHAYPSRTVAAKFLSRAVVKAGAPFLPGMVRAAKEAHGLCQDFTGTGNGEAVRRLRFSFFSRDKKRLASTQRNVHTPESFGQWANTHRDDGYTEQGQEALQHL